MEAQTLNFISYTRILAQHLNKTGAYLSTSVFFFFYMLYSEPALKVYSIKFIS